MKTIFLLGKAYELPADASALYDRLALAQDQSAANDLALAATTLLGHLLQAITTPDGDS